MNKQKNKCMDRMKRDDFTLSELLMKKTCKNGVSFRRCQFAPCLIFPFFLQLLNCSIVQMFKCFPVLQSSLFLCSYFEGENKNFHPHRAPHRGCDDHYSCRIAAAGAEQGETQRSGIFMHQQSKTNRTGSSELYRRLERIFSPCKL